jgi:hypothetical protein
MYGFQLFHFFCYTNPGNTFVRAIIINSPQSRCDITAQPDSSQDNKFCLHDDISVMGAAWISFRSKNTTWPSSSGPNILIDPLLLPSVVQKFVLVTFYTILQNGSLTNAQICAFKSSYSFGILLFHVFVLATMRIYAFEMFIAIVNNHTLWTSDHQAIYVTECAPKYLKNIFLRKDIG